MQENLRGLFPESPLEYVRTVYCSFVQGLFAAADPQYRWDPDPRLSQILITDSDNINASELNKRPAVTFKRGPVQSMNLGINDRLRYDASTGQVTKSLILPGSMSINVISRVPQEAENLAWVITENMWLHRQIFMSAGFMDAGRAWVIGAASPAGSLVEGDGGDEWYAVVISSPFQMPRTSVITPLGHKIAEHIGVNTSVKSSAKEDTYERELFPGVRVTAKRVLQGHGVAPTAFCYNAPTPAEPTVHPRQPIQGPPGPQGIPGPGGGSTLERTADVNLSGNFVVFASAGDGANYADPSVPVHGTALLGVTAHAAIAGSLVQVIQSGEMQDATWSWTPGLPIFCGPSGILTQTPPTSGWLRKVAYATSATQIVVGLGPLYLLA